MLDTVQGTTLQDAFAPVRPTQGILLVHGITGTTTEMRWLARYFQVHEYRVSVPLLPGHGAGHRELLATTRHDWLNGVRRAFDALAATCDSVLIVGLCGGGLLSVLLAAEDQRVQGLIVLSADLGFRAPGPASPWTRVLLPLASRVPLLRRYGYWTQRPPYGLKDPRLQRRITRSVAGSRQGQTAEYGTFRTYVGTIDEMKRLHEDVQRQAGHVSCPTLIMHSVEDTLFTIRNAALLYRSLGSPDKTMTLVTGCDHVMTVDVTKDQIAEQIALFARRVIPWRDRKPADVC